MQPNKSAVHIDKALTDFSIAFMQNPADYVAGIVPVKAVSRATDKYFKFNPGAMIRDHAKLRAAGAESEGSGYELSTDTYSCDKYALHQDIDFDTLANADAPLDLEQGAAEFLAENMQIRREALFASAAWSTSIWSTDVLGSGTYKFSDYTNSNPITVFDNAKKVVRAKGLVTPETLILGEDVYLALKEHPDLVDRIKYTQAGVLQEQQMAALLGVSRIIVARALVNSGVEGLSDSIGSIVSAKSALLVHLPQSVGLKTKSGLTCFAWTGAPHLPRPNGVVTRRFDMDSVQSRRIETEICLDFKVTAPDVGCFFSAIVD